jgi:hypothetical protein
VEWAATAARERRRKNRVPPRAFVVDIILLTSFLGSYSIFPGGAKAAVGFKTGSDLNVLTFSKALPDRSAKS